MSADWAGMDLIEVAAAIAGRLVTSVEVTEACLARVRQWQPVLNCFLRIEEHALETAHERDRELARGQLRGPLHGLPLAHKDLFYRAGRVCTAGSRILRDFKPRYTATVLEKLDEAGAIDIGTLNLSEFAAGPTGHNIHYGDCRNAFHPEHIAGGSSSGSAAAVAARLVYGALGSDTGASIRLPVAANGVTGLKPTYGRVSRYGVFPRSWSLDHIGPIARSARDCALLFELIAGFDTHDATTSRRPVPRLKDVFQQTQIESLRIGVPAASALGEVHPEISAALERVAIQLTGLGATLQTVPFANPKEMSQVAEIISKCEAAAIHRHWLKTKKQDYSAHVRIRIEAGLFIPATQYIDALRLRTLLTERFLNETMDGIDLLLLPVIPCPVPRIDEMDIEHGGGEQVLKLARELTRLTRPINLLGLPAISVPCGFCSKGLPIAFQLVGHPFDEATLLRVAHFYQRQTDFHRRVPVLAATPAVQEVSKKR